MLSKLLPIYFSGIRFILVVYSKYVHVLTFHLAHVKYCLFSLRIRRETVK
jgi:hypothetical protein